jgi:hypothetical protein
MFYITHRYFEILFNILFICIGSLHWNEPNFRYKDLDHHHSASFEVAGSWNMNREVDFKWDACVKGCGSFQCNWIKTGSDKIHSAWEKVPASDRYISCPGSGFSKVKIIHYYGHTTTCQYLRSQTHRLSLRFEHQTFTLLYLAGERLVWTWNYHIITNVHVGKLDITLSNCSISLRWMTVLNIYRASQPLTQSIAMKPGSRLSPSIHTPTHERSENCIQNFRWKNQEGTDYLRYLAVDNTIIDSGEIRCECADWIQPQHYTASHPTNLDLDRTGSGYDAMADFREYNSEPSPNDTGRYLKSLYLRITLSSKCQPWQLWDTVHNFHIHTN